MNQSSNRLVSLDFFRGATVAAMILVNNPGDWGHIYSPLEHAEWNGCTPTDLVFPFFLFIVGVSIAYAMDSSKTNPSTHYKTIKKAFIRSLILFALGLFLSLFPKIFTDPVESFRTVRIPGVLQRISLVFFFCSVLFLKNSERNLFRIAIILLGVYWALMTFVPVPGVGFPNLGKETNLGAWIDRTLLGTAHLWKMAITWDPEGILGTIPAVATGLFGVLTGIYLKRRDVEEATKVSWLFSAGLAAVMLGLLWDLEFPINKSLWTSSYVLFSGGLSVMFLAMSYWLIDIQKYKAFTPPFIAYGTNAITVFFLSGLIPRTLNMIRINKADGTNTGFQTWIYITFFEPNFSPVNASLAWAVAFNFFWFAILWIMYKKKIIIKV